MFIIIKKGRKNVVTMYEELNHEAIKNEVGIDIKVAT